MKISPNTPHAATMSDHISRQCIDGPFHEAYFYNLIRDS